MLEDPQGFLNHSNVELLAFFSGFGLSEGLVGSSWDPFGILVGFLGHPLSVDLQQRVINHWKALERRVHK